MKVIKKLAGLLLFYFMIQSFSIAQSMQISAKDIVDKANELIRGKSSYYEMEMTVVRTKWQRTLRFKGWSKGTEFSMIYIDYPAKEKGQVFLKRYNEMWNYMPDIEKMIKIPPSMMMQSWMGSDLTNDDLVKGASIVEDYTHKILREENINGYDCWVVELVPKENAIVVWGKIVSWISKEGYMTLKNEYYDEDDYLVNTESLSKIKNVGDRIMPTFFEIIPEDKSGQKTTMEFTSVKFNQAMDDDFFSIQQMKRIK